MSSPNFLRLFDMHAIMSREKQIAFSNVHPKQDHRFHKPSGELEMLKNGETFTVQVLGIEDYVAGAWRWGWSDQVSEFPKKALQFGSKLKQLGEQNLIREFTRSEMSLDRMNAEQTAMIACGLFKATAYWRIGKAKQFTLYVLITGDHPQVELDRSPAHLIKAISTAVRKLELTDQQRAIKYFLVQNGFKCELADDRLIATLDGTPTIQATFDAQQRLLEVGEIHAKPALFGELPSPAPSDGIAVDKKASESTVS